MNVKVIISLFAIVIAPQLYADNYKYPFRNPNLPIEERVEDLVSRLTPEQKIRQMVNAADAIPHLDIPPYNWWSVALHGVSQAGKVTMFPQAIALGATFDEEAMLESFTMISDEARAKYNDAQKNQNYGRFFGLTFWTPSADLFRDPRWGRGMETYGEDPYLITRFGVAAVKGLQGDDPKYFKLHAGAKHFAVHSGPEWNRHSIDVSVSDYDLYETYLAPFEVLIKEANVQEVMAAYNRYDGVPCSCSDFLLQEILRKKWGYEALIFSECGGIIDFWKEGHHETHKNPVEASIAAIEAGVDYECGSQFLTLVPGLNDGSIDATILDEPIRRIMKSRMELGMFDPQEIVPFSKIGMEVVECEKHLSKALEMAEKSIVLLENKDNILPLDKNIKHIAVVGPNADDQRMLWGNYHGRPSHTITILEGIKSEFPNFEITYIKGCEHLDPILDPAEVVEGVASADVIIFVGGISPLLEGEEMAVLSGDYLIMVGSSSREKDLQQIVVTLN
ncbi:MAG: glycoside hydrolase family 3 N-terminal domain-containing protein [Rikenellaceae bacterium]